ncbi:MAG: 3-deoxy-D-manno-octulosonate 8-phosphate phosphatase [Bacteroidetes bacterium GWF2_49_14]|nr:MAG: 3-deoxy-D-manno-octulosonate 8-phosphate phosphatase [Bacteroidetes bacterium GWF2_49_14]HBB90552.1 3-deoxy-D-manno-octulosonate 8-phosphate phosphatase [Bacteroidales bacterium]
MNFFREDLRGIRAFAFDVDGVLSTNELTLHPAGDMMRTVNTRDGFAIRKAINEGFKIAIITGAESESLRKRFGDLGTGDIFLGSTDKVKDLLSFTQKWGIDQAQILYMGDDIPDLEVMQIVGLPTCPSDAVSEILAISRYISTYPGGHGCVRDVIEQVLRSQGYWNFT